MLAAAAGLGAALGAAPGASPAGAAVTTDNFLLRTTHDLVELCGAPRGDPLFSSAIHLCHGFLVGVYQYHEALTSGRAEPPIICVQVGRELTRDDAAQLFVAWARERPQLMNERPVEGLMRWAVEAWPCPRRAPRRTAR